jgi:hypothetical protein
MNKEQESMEELKQTLERYDLTHNQLIAIKRLELLKEDPKAPICLHCQNCVGKGLTYHCPIFELPEDGKVVGNFGDVYWKRGNKTKTYDNVPMKPEDCGEYESLSALRIERK